jgi:hypothetical protein
VFFILEKTGMLNMFQILLILLIALFGLGLISYDIKGKRISLLEPLFVKRLMVAVNLPDE